MFGKKLQIDINNLVKKPDNLSLLFPIYVNIVIMHFPNIYIIKK